MSGRMTVYVGISGWRYAGWRGVFYPPGLRQSDELTFAADRFDSIEINGSFYSLQRPECYARWRDATPEDFVFSVKGGRFITHMLRLRNVETALANFFASGLLLLREKLGPILWQFPESLHFDERFERFFEMLPRDTREAAALARRHDDKVAGRAAIESRGSRPLRHAIEIRSPTFRSREFVRLLRRHDIGLVVADTAGRWPYLEDVTSDFVYLRLHGDEKLYESGYSRAAIERWAQRIEAWSRGGEPPDAERITSDRPIRRKSRDVYVYFDNDIKVHAPFDALALTERLDAGPSGAAKRPFGHPRGVAPRAQKRHAS
jgi:uncharacterized protein YecE (DUF72 family)